MIRCLVLLEKIPHFIDAHLGLCCHDIVDEIEKQIRLFDNRVEHIHIHMEPNQIKLEKKKRTKKLS